MSHRDEHQFLYSSFGSSNSYGGECGAVSARAWEEGLDAVVTQTDDNIEKLLELQRLKPKLPSQSNRIVTAPTGTRARSISASRLSASESPVNKEGSLSAAAATERKVDFLFRKTKLLDEKLKLVEKEKLDMSNFTQDTMNAVQCLTDSHKADQKTISTMKDTIAALKCSLEAISRREMEMAAKIDSKTTPTTSADIDAVSESLKSHFNTMMNETAQSCAAEQSKVLVRLAEKAAAESERIRVESRRYESEIIPAVEKEVKRIISEFSRLKSRQDSIDISFHSLQTAVGTREKRAEEAHRRAISSYRKEMSTVMDTVGKRMNEYLTLNNSQKTTERTSDAERHSHRLSSIDAVQRDLSMQLKECSSVSFEAILLVKDLQNQIAKKDSQNSTDGADRAQHVSSFESTVKQLRAEIWDLKSNCIDHQTSSSIALESVTDSNRKIKGKVNELSVGMASVSRIREAVESLLLEVHTKTKAEEPPSDLRNTLSGIYARLAAMEAASSALIKDNNPTKEPKNEVGLGLAGADRSTPPALQEQLERDVSRMQAELEEALQTGWADSMARHTRAADEVTKLGEVVQRLQGVVISMQGGQQGLEERVASIEEGVSRIPAMGTRNAIPLLIETPLTRQHYPSSPSMQYPTQSASHQNAYSERLKDSYREDISSPGEYRDLQSPVLGSNPHTHTQTHRSPNVVHVHGRSGRSSNSGSEGGSSPLDLGEDTRMNIRMLASLTDVVYKNTAPHSSYKPVVPLSSTSSAAKLHQYMPHTPLETSQEGRVPVLDSAWDSVKLQHEESSTAASPCEESSSATSSVGSPTRPPPHSQPPNHPSGRENTLSDPSDVSDSASKGDLSVEQQLFLKKSQHRSMFLKSVMSKK